jgi:hypothetical protein
LNCDLNRVGFSALEGDDARLRNTLGDGLDVGLVIKRRVELT